MAEPTDGGELTALRTLVEDLQAQVAEVRAGPDAAADQIRELRTTVGELKDQLLETQAALEASDAQLTMVSGECERVKGEARAVLDLVGALTGTGPSSLATVFNGFLESQAKLLAVQTSALAIQSGPPLAPFSGEDIEVEANAPINVMPHLPLPGRG